MKVPFFATVFCILIQVVVNAEGEPSIEANSECNVRLSIDRALIQFDTAAVGMELFATNSYCYKCSKSLIASESGSCAILFTPHEWSIYAVNNETKQVFATKEYTFGEHGEYIVSYSQGQLSVNEVKSPIDTYTPLYTVTGLVFALVLISLAYPALKAVRECRSVEEGAEDDMESRFSMKSTSSQPLLRADKDRDSDGGSSRRSDGVVSQRGSTSAGVIFWPHDDTCGYVFDESILLGTGGTRDASLPPKKSARVMSLDTFRGLTLFFMIFVNYGSTAGTVWLFGCMFAVDTSFYWVYEI